MFVSNYVQLCLQNVFLRDAFRVNPQKAVYNYNDTVINEGFLSHDN